MSFCFRLGKHLAARSSAVAAFSVLAFAVVVSAGSLTPSGAPASTMNTLAEIYGSIVGTYDSSTDASDVDGNLMENLKYIESQLGWASASNNLYYLGSGNVGIGDSSPETKFEVVGAASVSQLYIGGSLISSFGVSSDSLDFDEFVDSMTLDANTTIASGGYKIGIDSQGYAPAAMFSLGRKPFSQGYISGSSLTPALMSVVKRFGTVPVTSALFQTIWDLPSGGGGVGGYLFANQTASSSAQNMTGTLIALTGVAEHVGTGTATAVRGVLGQGSNRNTGSLASARGVVGAIATFGGAGTTTNAYNISTETSITTGTVSNLYGFYASRLSGTGGVISNWAGMGIEHLTQATNNTGLLIASTSSALNIPAGNFGIYNGSPHTNYFASNLGIGDSSPETTLEIVGTASVSGQSYFGSNVSVSGNFETSNFGAIGPNGAINYSLYQNRLGYQTESTLAVNRIITSDTGNSLTIHGVSNDMRLNFAATGTDYYVGQANYIETDAANVGNIGYVYGQINQIVQLSATNMTTAYGSYNVVNPQAGNVTDAYGLVSAVHNSGAGAITNAYVLYADVPLGSGTITNRYGLYVGAQNGTGVVNGFNIYSAGATSRNVFEGHASVSGNFELTGFVSSNLTPTVTDTYDLGTSALRWRDLYLASGSLHIGTSGDEAVIDYNVNDDYLSFKPNGSTTAFVMTDTGNMGIGTTSPEAKLDVAVRDTATNASHFLSTFFLEGTGDMTAETFLTALETYASSSGNISNGTLNYFTGGDFTAAHTGTISDTSGAWMVGMYGSGYFGGSMNSSGELKVVGGYFGSNGDIGTTGDTKHYGIEVGTTNGTADTNVGIFINNVGNATANYAIYSSATAQSYFAGNIGIGVDQPETELEVLGIASASEVHVTDGIMWYGQNILNIDQGGSIELGGDGTNPNSWATGQPYIDFHYGNGLAEDYNVRIHNPADYELAIQAGLFPVAITVREGDVEFGGNGSISGNFKPMITNTYTLGDSTHYWANIFATTASISNLNITNFTNTATGSYSGPIYINTTAQRVIHIRSSDGDGTQMMWENTDGARAYSIYTTGVAGVTSLGVPAGSFAFVDSTANLTRMYLDSSGNLGLGTSGALSNKLQVSGTANISGNVVLGSNASVSGNFELTGFVSSNLTPRTTDTFDLGTSALRWRDLYLASGSLHIGTSGDEAVIDYNVNNDYLALKPNSFTNAMQLFDTGAASISNTLYVSSGGNVGIGDSSPNYKLELGIGGDINLASSGAALRINGAAILHNRGTDSVALGDLANSNITSAGQYNVAMGSSALRDMVSGDSNIALGWETLYLNTAGNANIALGTHAMSNSTAGGNNIAIGVSALGQGTNMSFNVAVGDAAGLNALGSGNIFLGAQAGLDEHGGNTLWIDNTNTASDSAFIYGELDTDYLRIGANLETIGTASVSGAVYLTGLSGVDGSENYLCLDTATEEVYVGATCTPSSIRFKEHVEGLEHGLDWVSQLRPVTFDWKESGEPSLGFIAEEVEEVSPLLALYQEDEVWSVNYQIMTAVLAKAIQEQQAMIEALQNSVNQPTIPLLAEDDATFLDRIVALFSGILGIEFGQGSVKTDTIESQRLCVGSVCVTEEQFLQMVESSGVEAETPTPTPIPSDEPTPTPGSTPEPTPENGSSDEPFQEPTPEPTPVGITADEPEPPVELTP